MADENPDGLDRFRRTYGLEERTVLDEIEQEVIGVVFRANGYTTLDQAIELGRRMELGPESLLLDIGTGCGWPALYLASVTGCRVVATDVPLEGLEHAVTRARADGLGGRAGIVASAAQALPFRGGSFDAITHTDVLC
jgi:cyclopropane fatty-acyl-phospholipid synthase-like methyltransferase